jgi:streptomycin 6-kinase
VGPFPEAMVDAALRMLGDLLRSSPPPVLLHGDLHHHNILSAQREPWLVIDPKGLAGDPAYDVGAWLKNPMPWLLEQADPKAIQERRIRQFSSELGIDAQRLRSWGFVNAVLSGLWSGESGNWEGVERMVQCAELFGID